MITDYDTGRANQKKRTRMAIVEACRDIIRAGSPVTMPEVARAALVSEATAYRYFPDLPALVSQAFPGLWPSPAEALAPVADSTDPVERVAFACEFLLRGVLALPGRGPGHDRGHHHPPRAGAGPSRPAVRADRPGPRSGERPATGRGPGGTGPAQETTWPRWSARRLSSS